jgi:hypothetical protein
MKIRYLVWLAMLSLTAGFAHAHHAAQAQFDVTTINEITGVVSNVQWINPHPQIYVDVTDENGQVNNWHFEAAALNVMRRTGTVRKLNPGDTFTVRYWPARNGADEGLVRALVNADGEEIFSLSLAEINK